MKPKTIQLNALIYAYKSHPTPQLEEQLLVRFLPLAVNTVTRYLKRPPSPDELQETRIACLVALRKWNPRRNGLFAPVLSHYIQKMLWDWKGMGRTIRLPKYVRVETFDEPEQIVSLEYVQAGAYPDLPLVEFDFQRVVSIMRVSDPLAADSALLIIEQGFSYREAAQKLARPPGTVYDAYCRALTRLREMLGDYEET